MSPLLRVVINHAAGICLESDRGTKQLTVLGMVRNLLWALFWLVYKALHWNPVKQKSRERGEYVCARMCLREGEGELAWQHIYSWSKPQKQIRLGFVKICVQICMLYVCRADSTMHVCTHCLIHTPCFLQSNAKQIKYVSVCVFASLDYKCSEAGICRCSCRLHKDKALSWTNFIGIWKHYSLCFRSRWCPRLEK